MRANKFLVLANKLMVVHVSTNLSLRNWITFNFKWKICLDIKSILANFSNPKVILNRKCLLALFFFYFWITECILIMLEHNTATCLFSLLPNHVVISCSRIQNIAKRESIILTNRTKVKVRQGFYEKIESNIESYRYLTNNFWTLHHWKWYKVGWKVSTTLFDFLSNH